MRRYRWLLGIFAGLLASLALSAPVQVAASNRTYTATLTASCPTLTGTYAWAGFSSATQSSYVYIVDATAKTIVASNEGSGGPSGSVSITFSSAVRGHSYYAAGYLIPVQGSFAYSSFTTC